jgi:hypothetical protein
MEALAAEGGWQRAGWDDGIGRRVGRAIDDGPRGLGGHQRAQGSRPDPVEGGRRGRRKEGRHAQIIWFETSDLMSSSRLGSCTPQGRRLDGWMRSSNATRKTGESAVVALVVARSEGDIGRERRGGGGLIASGGRSRRSCWQGLPLGWQAARETREERAG